MLNPPRHFSPTAATLRLIGAEEEKLTFRLCVNVMTTLLHHAFATYDSESFESVLQDLLAVLRHHFGWVCSARAVLIWWRCDLHATKE